MMAMKSGTDTIRGDVLARLFSAAVLGEMAAHERSPMLARLIPLSGLDIDPRATEPIGTVFDDAFDHLKQREHRHEYVYKAALVEKVLLGRHSLATASMMTEFRVGRCKADAVVLNGTGNAYEIKSERDSLHRLQGQVDAYSRVFGTVNVIVGENHLRSVEAAVPRHVGIRVLTRRYQISEHREADDDPGRTKTAAIFEAINQREATRILRKADRPPPDVPNTERYEVLRKLFLTLDREFAHQAMVDCLKQTRSLYALTDVLDAVPRSLRAALIATPLSKHGRGAVVQALKTPICEALSWG